MQIFSVFWSFFSITDRLTYQVNNIVVNVSQNTRTSKLFIRKVQHDFAGLIFFVGGGGGRLPLPTLQLIILVQHEIFTEKGFHFL